MYYLKADTAVGTTDTADMVDTADTVAIGGKSKQVLSKSFNRSKSDKFFLSLSL